MKRTKLKEHADGYHSGARETRVKGTSTPGPEEEEQCRRSRHQVMRRRSSVEGVDTSSRGTGVPSQERPLNSTR
ncbi:hypothetical protein NDA11_006413 [Ustilago hordei]|nr:hypothetical protein NDA11_006413 [Ustilago hordei]